MPNIIRTGPVYDPNFEVTFNWHAILPLNRIAKAIPIIKSLKINSRVPEFPLIWVFT
jgi:hypothetical protein